MNFKNYHDLGIFGSAGPNGLFLVKPWLWLAHWRARRALKGYPLYDVPHKKREKKLREKQVQENFDYFMAHRLERLAHFQSWLWRHFRVKATLDGDGLLAVNAWVNKYAGGMITDRGEHDERAAGWAFMYYQPLWEGDLTGCNVMVDLGIFIGEYLIARRPHLHWIIDRSGTGKTRHDSLRPIIAGMALNWRFDAMLHISQAFESARMRSTITHFATRPGNPDWLVALCRETLQLANVPLDTEYYVHKDTSDEPL